MSGRIGCLAIFVGFFVSLACFNAWQQQVAPFECNDGYGHGPDPDTRECRSMIEAARIHRPQAVRDAFIAPLAAGAALLVVYFMLLPVARLPFFQGQSEREQ